MAAEEKFGVKIPDDELPKLKTVGDAVNYIETQRLSVMTLAYRRIVVTGLGATTPLGGDVTSFWAGLLEGRSGVVALDQDWAERAVRPHRGADGGRPDRGPLAGAGPPARPLRAGRAGRGAARPGPTPGSPARRARPASNRPASPS